MADNYNVVKQTTTIAQLPDGTFGQVVRVTFTTRGGALHAIDVPATSYNAENVKSMIEARVRESEAIDSL